METCLQRPILLTCSTKDQTVRVWDYISNTQVLSKSFVIIDTSSGKVAAEPLSCAAMHPSGYYLAVGLTENIKIYHLMHDDLRLFHTYDIKRSKRLKFSTGGQYLVAATDKHIILLSTYGLEQLCKLDSPSQQVTALAFNQDDSILSFMSADGFH